jgi:hypothetical protein
MRSRPAPSFRLLYRCALLVTVSGPLLLGAGCQHNRSFFQMDSNSRVPFFGMDFTPQWPKRGSRSGSGVSRLQSHHPAEAVPSSGSPLSGPPQATDAAVSLALPAADSPAVRRTSDSGPVEAFR